MHQLHLGVVPVVEGEPALGAAGQEGGDHQGYAGQDQNRSARRLHGEGQPAAAARHPPLHPAQSGVQHQGHGHKDGGAPQNHGHVLLADGGVEQPAQSAAPHEGGEDGGADGVDGGNADAGDQHGGGQGDVHMEQAVGGAHAHAGGGLLQVAGHLGQAQGGVPGDGQQGVEGQTDHGGGGAWPGDDHNHAQQGQGGDGLNQVHHPQQGLADAGGEVGQQPQGHPGGHGQNQGGQHQGQVVPDHGNTHVPAPPFRRPLGTTRFCRASTSPPSTRARMAAGMAPWRIRALLLELTPW